jgi:serine palmitoyltransferase
VTNLASYNFFNFNSNETLKDKAINTLRIYGVGPCGPPGFYGTQDVHMKTEADVAAHLGTESCIIYAQTFSTISSVIPAFSKRGDIIVADKAINYAARKGIQISRSTVRWYEHNDMEDLERVLQKVIKEQAKKPLTRRFIITEGMFEMTGECVDLPKVVRLADLGLLKVGMLTHPRLSSSSNTNSASFSTRHGHMASLAGQAVASLRPKMLTLQPLI